MTFRKTVECGFALKLVRDMIITYSQMHRTDKYSQHSSIIWPLSGCGFESRCCHLNFRASTSSKESLDIQANYRVWIHSETRTWHDNDIQSSTYCFRMKAKISADFRICISVTLTSCNTERLYISFSKEFSKFSYFFYIHCHVVNLSCHKTIHKKYFKIIQLIFHLK